MVSEKRSGVQPSQSVSQSVDRGIRKARLRCNRRLLRLERHVFKVEG